MTLPSSDIDLRLHRVRAMWQAFEARDWEKAASLMAPEAICFWRTSRERFSGAAAIVHVNAVYPEGWHIDVLAVEPLAHGRVLSLVRLDHDGASHYAHSWFGFDAEDRIASIDDYWAEVTEPPAWREGLPGRERTGLA